VINNPLRHNDPSGFKTCDPDTPGSNCTQSIPKPEKIYTIDDLLADYGVVIKGPWDEKHKYHVLQAVAKVALGLMTDVLLPPTEVFRRVYGVTQADPLTMLWGTSMEGLTEMTEMCAEITNGGCTSGSHLINFVSLWADPLSAVANIIHELGHACADRLEFRDASTGRIIRPTDDLIKLAMLSGLLPDRPRGYAGDYGTWQQSPENSYSENFADMFLGWNFGKWSKDAYGLQRMIFMGDLMQRFVAIAMLLP
jgi:hypothetical protein